MASTERLTSIAKEASLRAGQILKEGFGTSFSIETKGSTHDLVTEYDKKAEKAIIDIVQEAFPDHQILAEESGASGEGEFTWVIDPLDGTVNFAHNIPFFSTSIGIAKGDEILSGVIYNPMLDELFIAEKGKGATLNGKPISVTKTESLSHGILATGFPYNIAENPLHCLDQFAHLSKLGIPIRRMGSAALDLAYVACGRFDSFWDVILNPWDFAAGSLIVHEAGGKVSNLGDRPLTPYKKSSVVASNTLLHEEAIEHLAYYESL